MEVRLGSKETQRQENYPEVLSRRMMIFRVCSVVCLALFWILSSFLSKHIKKMPKEVVSQTFFLIRNSHKAPQSGDARMLITFQGPNRALEWKRFDADMELAVILRQNCKTVIYEIFCALHFDLPSIKPLLLLNTTVTHLSDNKGWGIVCCCHNIF